MSDTPFLDQVLLYVNSPSNPTFRPEGGETLDTLDRLAHCAFSATRDQPGRLKHVADNDVPRLIAEVVRLREVPGE